MLMEKTIQKFKFSIQLRIDCLKRKNKSKYEYEFSCSEFANKSSLAMKFSDLSRSHPSFLNKSFRSK